MPVSHEPLTPYQRRLFLFLGVATFFEGFEYAAITQLLPTLRADFALSHSATGYLLGVLNFGAVLAYFLVRKADQLGRRPVLNITIVGYTLFSVATALASDVYLFAAAQVLARMFLLAEYVVSMLYAAEDFPASRRGFAAGVMQGLNTFGAITCAGLVPLVLKTPLGWRGMYVVGALPLIVLAVARRSVQETTRFSQLKASGQLPPRDLLRLWRSPYRGRMLLLAAIWSLSYLCLGVLTNVWKDFALRERGLSEKEAALAITIAALFSLPLVFFSGTVLDWLGRRKGATLIFTILCGSTVGAYTLHGRWPLTIALIYAIFSASAVLPVLTTLTTELFPTDLRADGFGWANNLLGRVGFVASPLLVGMAAERVGWGPAVASTAVFPFLALLLVLWKVPETGGRELESTGSL